MASIEGVGLGVLSETSSSDCNNRCRASVYMLYNEIQSRNLSGKKAMSYLEEKLEVGIPSSNPLSVLNEEGLLRSRVNRFLDNLNEKVRSRFYEKKSI